MRRCRDTKGGGGVGGRAAAAIIPIPPQEECVHRAVCTVCARARAHFAIQRGYRYCRDLLPVQTVLYYAHDYYVPGHLFVLPRRGTNDIVISNGFTCSPLVYVVALYKIIVISITIYLSNIVTLLLCV